MKNYILNQTSWDFIRIRQLDWLMEGHKGYIAGGVFKNIFNNEKFKDVDIFFESKKDYLAADEKFKKDENFKAYYDNDKVTAYRNKDNYIVVELIKHKYLKPLDMLEDFDFTITKFAYYKEEIDEEDIFYDEDGELEKTVEWKVAYHKDFFQHLHLKRLVIDKPVKKIILPVNTFNRTYRYAKYGYFPCRETKVKIIESLRNLDNFSEELLALGLYDGLD